MADITSEKYIDAQLCKKVKELGGLCLKMGVLHFAGIPDRLVILPNIPMFFVEVKTTGKKPSLIQKVVIAKLERLNQKVVILDNIADINKTLYI